MTDRLKLSVNLQWQLGKKANVWKVFLWLLQARMNGWWLSDENMWTNRAAVKLFCTGFISSIKHRFSLCHNNAGFWSLHRLNILIQTVSIILWRLFVLTHQIRCKWVYKKLWGLLLSGESSPNHRVRRLLNTLCRLHITWACCSGTLPRRRRRQRRSDDSRTRRMLACRRHAETQAERRRSWTGITQLLLTNLKRSENVFMWRLKFKVSTSVQTSGLHVNTGCVTMSHNITV